MAVFLAAAMMLSAMPSWLAASDAIPLNRNGGPAVDLMMTLFGYHAGLALCVATARSAPTPQRLLLFALWSALASFALFHYFAVDYPGHYALVLLGPALVLPWLIRGMRFPRRTAAGLAMGLSSCAVIFLQAMLHIFVILPAAENFAHGMEMRRAAIHATQTPAELEVLERSGMVGLIPIPEDASHPAYVYVNEAGISAIRERRARLEEDRPAVLKTWIILGDNDADQSIFVYDGRGLVDGEAARFSFMPATAAMESRINAMITYAGFTAASSVIWMISALLILLTHRWPPGDGSGKPV